MRNRWHRATRILALNLLVVLLSALAVLGGPGQPAQAQINPNQQCPPAITAVPNCNPNPPLQCPPGTEPSPGGRGCQPNPPQCPPGTQAVAGGCQPNPPPQCPPGTQAVAGGCEPNPPRCPPGTQAVAGGCQPNPPPVQQCPDGTVVAVGQSCAPTYLPPITLPGIPQGGSTQPVQTGVHCVDGSFAPTLAGCPQGPQPSPSGQTTPSTSPGLQPPATVTISGQNPVQLTIRANQFLDVTHSIEINLAPGVQATGVQVSTGSATIQGSQIVWNGFTLNAGDQASATINLAVTGGTTLTASGTPAIQNVLIQALDVSGNPVLEQAPGGGPTTDQLPITCTDTSGQPVPNCTGSSILPAAAFATRRLQVVLLLRSSP